MLERKTIAQHAAQQAIAIALGMTLSALLPPMVTALSDLLAFTTVT